MLVWHCRQGKHPDELLAKTTTSCPLEINTHTFNHEQQKKRRKTFTNIPFVAVLAVSRSRLSVATATRSSSEGLEWTLSFLPNGRTSGLPTSKNRVGIRFSVDWECRLLVYRWWQREVTIWGLGRRTIILMACLFGAGTLILLVACVLVRRDRRRWKSKKQRMRTGDRTKSEETVSDEASLGQLQWTSVKVSCFFLFCFVFALMNWELRKKRSKTKKKLIDERIEKDDYGLPTAEGLSKFFRTWT